MGTVGIRCGSEPNDQAGRLRGCLSPSSDRRLLELRSGPDGLIMDAAEVKARLEKALSPGYWESLAPLANVCRSRAQDKLSPVGHEIEIRSALDAMKGEGWFRLEGFFPRQQVRNMAECVIALERAGWLPTYILVFDEFWNLIRGQAFAQLLAKMIGFQYVEKVAAWVHLIEATGIARGWTPHIDARVEEGPVLHADGTPRLLSVWIALSDATVDNGCMYLIPADRIAPDEYMTHSSWQVLQSVQAVPLNAGGIAAWRQDLLHWGSFSSVRARGPRISIALEFQSATENGNQMYPLIDGGYIPSTLEERLYFISRQVLSYFGRLESERASDDHVAVAEALSLSLEDHGRNWVRGQPEPIPNA